MPRFNLALRAGFWLGLALFLSIVGFFYFVGLFEQGRALFLSSVPIPPDQKLELKDFADIGEYLNARFGLPLAALVGVSTALIATIAAIWTSRQNDVNILTFVENKADRAQSKWYELMAALGDFVFTAGARRAQIRQILDEIDERSNREGDPAKPEGTGSVAPIDAAVDRVTQAVLATRRTFSDQSAYALQEIEACMQDMYVAYFMRRWRAKRKSTEPLNFIIEKLATDDPVRAALKTDIVGVGTQMRNLAHNTTPTQVISAAYMGPDDADLIEVAGYMIGAYWIGLRHPVRLGNEKIIAVGFNVGAAQLLSIWHAIPPKRQIEQGLIDIFNYGASIARIFLRRVVQDAKEIAPEVIAAEFKRYDNPARLKHLIAVCIQGDGDRLRYERYDPLVHPRLPLKASARS